MDKLVILKSIGGDFERGFQCSLSIATEGQPIDLEVLGALPAHHSLLEDYWAWQATYRNLGLRSRISESGTVRLREGVGASSRTTESVASITELCTHSRQAPGTASAPRSGSVGVAGG